MTATSGRAFYLKTAAELTVRGSLQRHVLLPHQLWQCGFTVHRLTGDHILTYTGIQHLEPERGRAVTERDQCMDRIRGAEQNVFCDKALVVIPINLMSPSANHHDGRITFRVKPN